jgi:2-keto-4-pentenoate hydratase/2-oxohepta-3-ene-1,7-dioic acid hydratase in catechol pathway
MLVARIRVTAGPHQDARTYAEVRFDPAGSPEYLAIPDPFDPDATMTTLSTEVPIPARHAVLLAPCAPRVVLGMAHNTGPTDRLLPPQAFHKSPHSVIATGETIEPGPGHDSVDAEGEIAVVIGQPARHLTRENALSVAFGYTCANDVTDRAAQASESRWTEAKSRDTYTPLGPWIRTDIDPSDLTIQLGDAEGLGPQASTAGLARGVVDVLVYISSVMTLQPGDVVLTGAVGPSRRLQPGGVSRVIAPAIGELTNPVATIETRRDAPASLQPPSRATHHASAGPGRRGSRVRSWP